MRSNSVAPEPHAEQIQVTLDGLPVVLPADRRSLDGIRAHLERLAMEEQRILWALVIDGQPADLARMSDGPTSAAEAPAAPGPKTFAQIEAETIAIEDVPLQIVRTALDQIGRLIRRLESALALICINDAPAAREIWWRLARDLKKPLLTLNFLPEGICGPTNGRASLMQLRKWQLQQLAAIVRDVDEAARGGDTCELMRALEERALPWLRGLNESVALWHSTVAAGARLAAQP